MTTTPKPEVKSVVYILQDMKNMNPILIKKVSVKYLQLENGNV